jgi:homospermidine synthase
MAKITVSGVKHSIKKTKKGDVVVDHPPSAKAGKNDKINLTKKAGVKTVKAGERATRAWHRKNPHKGGK